MPFSLPLNSLPLNRHQHRCQSHSLLLFHFFLLHFLHHLPLNTEFHDILPLNSYKTYNLRNPFNFLNPLNLRNLHLLHLHNPYKWNLKPVLIKSNQEEEPIPWRDNSPNISLRPCLSHSWAHPPLQSCSRSCPRQERSQQYQFQQHPFRQHQFQLQRLQQPKKPDPSSPVNRLRQPNEKGKARKNKLGRQWLFVLSGWTQ